MIRRRASSNVYDVFRTGRQRLNADLVAEVALALGETDAAAEGWRNRCRDIRLAPRQATVSDATAPVFGVPRVMFVIVVLVACVGLNLFGQAVIQKFELPIWLDMIGTAIAAIAFGPWQGVAVGLSTNLLGTVGGNVETLPFAIVNIVGALVWGYGYHRFGGNRGPVRFFVLNIVVAMACTLVAVPVNILVFGGVAGHASDALAASLTAGGAALIGAVFTVNILISVVDKLIAGYIALLVARRLARGEPHAQAVTAQPVARIPVE